MKYLSEYRNPKLALQIIEEIKKEVTKPWTLMEICGGQTHSLVKNGILNLLPEEITMVHGPGCPVCVTPMQLIDQAIEIAHLPKVILCTFGDMMRVPGSDVSLMQAKAEGADVQTVYSPIEAVKIAQAKPDQQIVFFAVGFETTAPANGLAVLQAERLGLSNFSILCSHVMVPPAMETILKDPEQSIDAFLAAGHVCTIMGTRQYHPIASKYKTPIVVTGFEPVDLLSGILEAIQLLESQKAVVENAYTRVVMEQGNTQAKHIIHQVFEVADQNWRGLGTIPASGLRLRDEFHCFDASWKFPLKRIQKQVSHHCMAGEILKGIKKPSECPAFGKDCTPLHPMGAPMVSSEGACAAYYHYAEETV